MNPAIARLRQRLRALDGFDGPVTLKSGETVRVEVLPGRGGELEITKSNGHIEWFRATMSGQFLRSGFHVKNAGRTGKISDDQFEVPPDPKYSFHGTLDAVEKSIRGVEE